MKKTIFAIVLVTGSIISKGQVVAKDSVQIDNSLLKKTINYSGSQLVRGQNQNIWALASAFAGSVFMYQGSKKDNSGLKAAGYISYAISTTFTISSFYTKRKAYKRMRDL